MLPAAMSRSAVRRLLWVIFALTLPLPILVVGPGLVPAARLLLLGGMSVAMMLFVRASGVVSLLSLVLLGQAFLYLAALWITAALLAALLSALPPVARTRSTLGLVALLLLAASAFEIYHTPFAAESARTSLLGLYR
jgi:hypothetical protein